jgi:hypothetical protein
MAGICDIETYVIDLNAPKKSEPQSQGDESSSIRPEGVVGSGE